jgi:hypothetical protein
VEILPIDFGQTAELIERSTESTLNWLDHHPVAHRAADHRNERLNTVTVGAPRSASAKSAANPHEGGRGFLWSYRSAAGRIHRDGSNGENAGQLGFAGWPIQRRTAHATFRPLRPPGRVKRSRPHNAAEVATVPPRPTTNPGANAG